MIILDTNVVSEPMRQRPDPAVQAWLDQQPVGSLYFSAVSLSELHFGIEVMADGRRKAQALALIQGLLQTWFSGRILPFDEAAALAYARLLAGARSSGRAIGMADGQVAAIAFVHGCPVATRDTTPFEAVGIPTIDPWRHAAH